MSDVISNINAENKAQAKEPVQYTLFASGLNHGGQNTVLEGKNLTNDLAIIFDVVDTHTYTQTAEKTSYAIESRSRASDHVSMLDGKFSFTARITDSPFYLIQQNFLDKDTDPENPMGSKRPGKSLEILTEIMSTREMVTLVTEDNILSNYVIVDLQATRSTEEGAALTYQISLEEFRIVALGRTVLARTTDPRKASNKQKGAVQTADGGLADNELQGKRSPFAGPSGGSYRTDIEQRTGITYDIDEQGGKIIRPDGRFSPTSLIRK